MIAYIQRFPLGVVVTQVQEELDLSDETMGWALGAFFFTYAAMQIPSGWLVDRWGSRASLALFVAFCALATGFTAAALGLATLMAARLALGAGQAGIFPAATGTLAKWFPKTERALASGWLTGFMSLGGVIATALTGWLLASMTWRWVFAVYALPGAAWTAVFYFWFRNRPDEHRSVSAAELLVIRGGAEGAAQHAAAVAMPLERTPWLGLLASPSMWLIAWQQFFRAAGYIFFGTWYPKFLQQVYGVSVEQAGWLTSIPLAAVVVGSPLGGMISDRLLERTGSRAISRKATAFVSMMTCGALFFAAAYQPRYDVAVALIAAAAFFAALPGPVAYAITIDMGGRHVGTVFSVMNMAGNIGAFVFPIVVGRMVGESWGGWERVPVLVAGIYVASSLCWLPLDPRGTVFDRHAE